MESYLLSKPEAKKSFPFVPDVAVFKISGKMYATLSQKNGVPNMNLKCDPAEAFILRDIFKAVIPAYHMNKTHWNTVILDGSIPEGEVQRMIDNSYSLVFHKLKKTERQRLEILYTPEQLHGEVHDGQAKSDK